MSGCHQKKKYITNSHLLFVIGLKIYSKGIYKESLDSDKRYS